MLLSDFEIRSAKGEDAAGLKECMQAAYSIYAARMRGEVLPPLEVDYATEIDSYPSWVASSNDKILGGLIMQFGDDFALLSNIAVHPQAQGKGLGRKLIEYAEQAALGRGYDRLRLATHSLLSENIALYEHLGWATIEKKDVRILMEKALASKSSSI